MVCKGRSAIVRCLIQAREASNHSHHQFSPSVRQAHRQAYGIGDRLLSVRNGCGKHPENSGRYMSPQHLIASRWQSFLYGFLSSVQTVPVMMMNSFL